MRYFALFLSRPALLLAITLACGVAPHTTIMAQSMTATDSPAHTLATVPAEVASTHFTVSIGGQQSPVLHAASNYYLLNFELSAPTEIVLTADDPHYWDAGVEVQPMRLGIRPQRTGASIRFTLATPAKISITRPGDYFSDSEMLFLFANPPDRSGYTPTTPGIRYFGPGVHHENIDASDGDHIYLADGAVVFGSLNVWGVHDVSVSGRGTLIYDGPQDPTTDQGWMHKRNWHVIVMDNASRIQIEGITCIVRSRTWMVQMRDSRDITFRNVKIIGGSASNANQDGMDWLGGGDTLVQDSFIRAADDIFAMQGNWDGYSEDAMRTPGHLVSNVTVEGSVLSTSISNVVRLGWPKKIFDSHGFTMRDSDVIHMGVGGCGIPFALFEIWADPAGEGEHSNIQFQNIRLDHWYSLLQIEQPNPGIHGISLQNIWSMDDPGMVGSVLKGPVNDVRLSGLNLNGSPVTAGPQVPLAVLAGAAEPTYAPGPVDASFTYSTGMIHPGREVTFEAKHQRGVTFRWLFGDGTSAEGRKVRHAFPDGEGTLLDGSGRFRVLLSATDEHGMRAWSSQSVVVGQTAHEAARTTALLPGLSSLDGELQGFVDVPADGGYTFWLLTSTHASLTVDGVIVNSARPHAQVCGSGGDAVQALRLSLVLRKGKHSLEVRRGPELENAYYPMPADPAAVLLWEGPGIPRGKLPESLFSHTQAATGKDRQ